jgi:hypothetical protein
VLVGGNDSADGQIEMLKILGGAHRTKVDRDSGPPDDLTAPRRTSGATLTHILPCGASSPCSC